MDYGEILSRGWQIIWKHKILWIFGILASCGANNFGNNSRYNVDRGMPGWANGMNDGRMMMVVAILIVLACVAVILFTFLTTMGRIGLIRGASRADQDLNTTLTFGDLFRDGMGYFWRIFLLNLMLTVLAFVLVGGIILLVVLGGGGIAAAGRSNDGIMAGMGAVMMIFIFCLCCLLLPVFIVLGTILEMVYNAILVEDLSIGAGLTRGWEVFKANLGSIALFWVILTLVIGLIGGFITGAPLFLVALPALAGSMGGRGSMSLGMVFSLICFVAYLPILLALRGIIQSYTQSTWTVAYRRFIGLGAGSPQSGGLPGSLPSSTGGASIFDVPPVEPAG